MLKIIYLFLGDLAEKRTDFLGEVHSFGALNTAAKTKLSSTALKVCDVCNS